MAQLEAAFKVLQEELHQTSEQEILNETGGTLGFYRVTFFHLCNTHLVKHVWLKWSFLYIFRRWILRSLGSTGSY